MSATTRFIIKTSSARMPSSCGYPYVRLAVLEVEDGYDSVSMISERARGVVRIVQTWEALPAAGKTPRSARGRAEQAAEELCERLNGGAPSDEGQEFETLSQAAEAASAICRLP